jgi:carbonic anhydrase
MEYPVLYPLLPIVLLLAAMQELRATGEGPGIAPDDALKRLQAGNARFVAGRSEHPHATPDRLAETSRNGQHPFAAVLACSDSRVPVERLFDQGFGDIFVMRVAGNVAGEYEIGSVEYGASHLETPLLVVLGHTQCGAVTAVATKLSLHGNIRPLAEKIKPAVAAARKANPSLHGKDLVPAATKANVWQSIDDLLKGSPMVRERVKAGKLRIVGAMYDIKTGKVEWLGPHPEMARLLARRVLPLARLRWPRARQ